jgi:hypothetical protein
MDINLRTDAPDQTDIIDPTLLSETIEQLKNCWSASFSSRNKIERIKITVRLY